MQVDGTAMYRVSAVAEALDISPKTVYRAIESGELDSMRFGKAIRVPGYGLVAWLDRCNEDARLHHVVAGESTADLDAAELDGAEHDGGVRS